jgi:GntR family transcriptional repressor for pyruvate dehydrogenase complex
MMASLRGFTSGEMFEARQSLEMAVAGLAAERATGEQLAAMSEEIVGMYASLDDPEQFLVHDMRFHQTVAAASGNRILTSLMNMVATILFDVRRKTVKRAKDLKESAEMHRQIYRAIRGRNPEGARAAISCWRRRRRRPKSPGHPVEAGGDVWSGKNAGRETGLS